MGLGTVSKKQRCSQGFPHMEEKPAKCSPRTQLLTPFKGQQNWWGAMEQSREGRKRDFSDSCTADPKDPAMPCLEFTPQRAAVVSLSAMWERRGKKAGGGIEKKEMGWKNGRKSRGRSLTRVGSPEPHVRGAIFMGSLLECTQLPGWVQGTGRARLWTLIKFRGSWSGLGEGILMTDEYVAWETSVWRLRKSKNSSHCLCFTESWSRTTQAPLGPRNHLTQCQLLTVNACGLRLHRGVQASAESAWPVEGTCKIRRKKDGTPGCCSGSLQKTAGRSEEVRTDQDFSGGMSWLNWM